MSRPRKFNKEDWGLVLCIAPNYAKMSLCHKSHLNWHELLEYEWRKIGLENYQKILRGEVPAETIWNACADVKGNVKHPKPTSISAYV